MTWGVSEVALKVEADQYTLPVEEEEEEEEEDDVVEFDLGGGSTVPSENFRASITMLGCSIYNWGYAQPVTVKVYVGDDVYEPFGDYTKPVNSNVHDGSNPRTFEIPEEYPDTDPWFP